MSFTDFIKLQDDVAYLLLGDNWLNDVNIVTRHKLLGSENKLPDKTLALEVLAYITPRNGRKGCGVIVEQPTIAVSQPNSPGPQKEIIVTCLVLEDPLTNNGPQTGTLRPADQVGQRILEAAHHWSADDLGDFFADRNAMQPAEDFEPLHAWRVRLRLHLGSAQTDRCNLPDIAEAGLVVTLTGSTPEADVFYSLDGTAPSPGNARAIRYEGPFAVDAGTAVRWAAWKSGMLPSRYGWATINA